MADGLIQWVYTNFFKKNCKVYKCSRVLKFLCKNFIKICKHDFIDDGVEACSVLIQFLFKNLITWLYLPMSPPIILLMLCVMWTGGGLANGNKGRYERERHVPGQLHAAHMSRKRTASYTPRYSSPPHLSHPHEFRLNSPIVWTFWPLTV